ncbi:MAG: response regulator, partial [Terriglobales bacterium]
IKFTETGEVLVHLESASAAQNAVELKFKVTDTGIGIPSEKQSILFRAFSQADSSHTRKYGGTGLGLAITARLVELMGGRIWLESAPGKGSTFHFTVRCEEATDIPVPARIVSSEGLAGVSVLIVDDNETNRGILSGLVNQWKMKATTAASGEEALTIFSDAALRGESTRLLLVDICMPGMDGFEFIHRVRRQPQFGNCAVVIVTSAVRSGDADRCKQLEVQAYLSKPVLKDDLLIAIRSALGLKEIAASAPEPEKVLRKSARSLQILAAEDNAVNQAVILRVLAKMGHKAMLAQNGREALRMSQEAKYDLIFMDVQMPEMDGLTATRAIREAERITGGHVPIFAMTAHAMTGDRERCLAAGMDGYLTKPMRMNEVAEVLAGISDAGAKAMEAGSIQARSESAAKPSKAGAGKSLSLRPPWNRAEAIERLGGDEDLFQELCQIFLEESPRLLRELKDALAAGNAEDAMRAAHSLKGETGYLSAPEAMSAARELEELARSNSLAGPDKDRAEKILIVLEHEWQTLCENIRTAGVFA